MSEDPVESMITVKVSYKERNGDWNGDTVNFPSNTSDDEIRQRLQVYIGKCYGDTRITATKDGEPFDL